MDYYLTATPTTVSSHSFVIQARSSLAIRVINCVDDVSNLTEFLWTATSRRQHFIPRGPITLSGVDIIPSRCVKLPGVYIDDDISASTQINKLVSSVFFIYDRSSPFAGVWHLTRQNHLSVRSWYRDWTTVTIQLTASAA